MPQDSQQEPRGGLGCLWVVLLVGAPFVLLVAIAVFIQSDDAAWRLWALALLALALAAALGSVWVRRIAMRRAGDMPADPAARLRKTFGSKRLQATVAAPNPVGGTLAPAYVSVPSSSDLTTVGGVAAGDGRIPRGLTVGWVQNGAELPRLDLYSASFDVELARAVSGELVPVQHGDLIDAWLVGADQAGALARLMGDPLLAALNTHGERAIAIIFDGWGVTSFSDDPDELDPLEAIGTAVGMRGALPDSLYRRRDGAAERDPVLAGLSAKTARRTAALGALSSEGSVKAQWQGLTMAGVFLTIFCVGALGALLRESGNAATGTIAALLCGVLAGGALAAVSIAATVRLDRRQRRVAYEVRRAAREFSARYRARMVSGEEGWSRPPFGSIARLIASPGAAGTLDGRAFGMAFMSGDAGVGRLRARTFTSRVVWVEVEQPLPPVTFVREGLSERMLAILGGADVDVESAAFNAAWRVRAHDPRFAHAMLQPTLIEMLVGVTEPGIAFHIDGNRVAVWDDATVGEADLVGRARLVSEFASRVPAFVAQDWNADRA